jgi:hypothetical protein
MKDTFLNGWKRFGIFLLGFLIAGIAGYSLPKDFKKESPGKVFMKAFHLAESPEASIVPDAITTDNFSPGDIFSHDLIKPYTIEIESRFWITNLRSPRYLARSGLSWQSNKLSCKIKPFWMRMPETRKRE